MKTVIKTSIIAAAMAAAFSTYAATPDAGVQVNFSGTLTSSSCAVSVNDGQSTIDMGSIDTSGLTVGETTPQQNFNVDIKNCPSSVTSAYLVFDGSTADAAAGHFSITSGTGNMTDHIAMQLLDLGTGGSIVKPSTSTVIRSLENGALSIPLAAQMVVLKDGVDDGDFTVSTSMHVIYQ
ncbi:fimbrial protein [Enterobacter bugandensis]|uniref:fimbrial protein n=1 Tax=Enterobacter bugandensis TaxID=881260 RepID=UPI000B4A202B|nr:fimbrial protein [Enterobacter bugandensis]QWZ48829.1 type 1 fimbrial protein [Enterobacter bugandensis]UBH41098.1 type 1 fimbrial protein [Enterobacter bugandensis]UBH92802.1 type 1 fimbrial protein [Enterobacter bugandensis]UBH99410.1 type 1 fimbrial protein [Enterobacter bugandensis]